MKPYNKPLILYCAVNQTILTGSEQGRYKITNAASIAHTYLTDKRNLSKLNTLTTGNFSLELFKRK